MKEGTLCRERPIRAWAKPTPQATQWLERKLNVYDYEYSIISTPNIRILLKEVILNMLKKTLAALLLATVLLAFTGCGASNEHLEQQIDQQTNIYQFENYESSDVFDIEKISTTPKLESRCTTYKFTYLSDNYKIKGYISLPNSAIDSQIKCKCLIFNRGGNSKIGWLEDTTTASMCSLLDRAVLASQYREADGSEGKDQFGGDDIHDVIKLIDLCEHQFSFIDMDDLCVAEYHEAV